MITKLLNKQIVNLTCTLTLLTVFIFFTSTLMAKDKNDDLKVSQEMIQNEFNEIEKSMAATSMHFPVIENFSSMDKQTQVSVLKNLVSILEKGEEQQLKSFSKLDLIYSFSLKQSFAENVPTKYINNPAGANSEIDYITGDNILAAKTAYDHFSQIVNDKKRNHIDLEEPDFAESKKAFAFLIAEKQKILLDSSLTQTEKASQLADAEKLYKQYTYEVDSIYRKPVTASAGRAFTFYQAEKNIYERKVALQTGTTPEPKLDADKKNLEEIKPTTQTAKIKPIQQQIINPEKIITIKPTCIYGGFVLYGKCLGPTELPNQYLKQSFFNKNHFKCDKEAEIICNPYLFGFSFNDPVCEIDLKNKSAMNNTSILPNSPEKTKNLLSDQCRSEIKPLCVVKSSNATKSCRLQSDKGPSNLEKVLYLINQNPELFKTIIAETENICEIKKKNSDISKTCKEVQRQFSKIMSEKSKANSFNSSIYKTKPFDKGTK